MFYNTKPCSSLVRECTLASFPSKSQWFPTNAKLHACLLYLYACFCEWGYLTLFTHWPNDDFHPNICTPWLWICSRFIIYDLRWLICSTKKIVFTIASSVSKIGTLHWEHKDPAILSWHELHIVILLYLGNYSQYNCLNKAIWSLLHFEQ